MELKLMGVKGLLGKITTNLQTIDFDISKYPKRREILLKLFSDWDLVTWGNIVLHDSMYSGILGDSIETIGRYRVLRNSSGVDSNYSQVDYELVELDFKSGYINSSPFPLRVRATAFDHTGYSAEILLEEYSYCNGVPIKRNLLFFSPDDFRRN